MDALTSAAIIGYWRCGASMEHIIALTGFPFNAIDQLINSYEKYNSNEPE